MASGTAQSFLVTKVTWPAIPPLNILWPETPCTCQSCPFRGANQFESIMGTDLNELDMLAREGCIKCRIVYRTCIMALSDWGQPREEGIVISIEPGIILVGKVKFRLYLPVGSGPSPWDFINTGRPLLESRRDGYLDLLKGWISDCEENHPLCEVPVTKLPTRVIDVGSDSGTEPSLYVSCDERGRYVALSHCWGRVPLLTTTRATLADRQAQIPRHQLSKTFQDAVLITRSLNVRYLWIDCLCIVQDDLTDWEIESSKMASIYQDAFLVLAASQATDSTVGILDVSNESRPETLRSHVGSIIHADAKTEIHMHSTLAESDGAANQSLAHTSPLPMSPLAQRAWTLQESMLASRIVHFTSTEIFWECLSNVKCECMSVDHNAKHRKAMGLFRHHELDYALEEDNVDQGTLHGRWRSLVAKYLTRSLTYEMDRLPALSGLASTFQTLITGTYLAGLWKEDLLRSLRWHKEPGVSGKRPQTYRAPSWSPFSVEYDCRGKPRSEPISWGYSRDAESWESYVDIEDVKCTPAGHNSLGTVKDGYLLLSGKILDDEITLSLSARRRIQDNGGDTVGFPMEARINEERIRFRAYFDVDIGSEDTRYYMLVLGCSSVTEWTLGLLLRVLDSNEASGFVFERVGLWQSRQLDDLEKMLEDVRSTKLKIL